MTLLLSEGTPRKVFVVVVAAQVLVVYSHPSRPSWSSWRQTLLVHPTRQSKCRECGGHQAGPQHHPTPAPDVLSNPISFLGLYTKWPGKTFLVGTYLKSVCLINSGGGKKASHLTSWHVSWLLGQLGTGRQRRHSGDAEGSFESW